MDPLTIVTSAIALYGVAVRVSSNLYALAEGARIVDRHVKDLATEFDSTTRMLKEVANVLGDPAGANASQGDQDLWKAVREAMAACATTVARLEQALDTSAGQGSKWASWILRRVRLNLSKDEVNSLRMKSQMNSINLGVVLQMANMRAIQRVPQVAAAMVRADMEVAIARLEQSIQKSNDLWKMFPEKRQKRLDSASGTIATADDTNTETIQACAGRYLEMAISIQGTTEATERDSMEPIDDQVRLRARTFIPDLIEPSKNLSISTTAITTPSSGDQTASGGNKDAEESNSKENSELAWFPVEQPSGPPEAKELIEFDASKEYFETGIAHFDSEEYDKALDCLEGGVATANKLPIALRDKLDMDDTPLMIATCRYHLDELDQAEEDLLKLVNEEPRNDRHKIRICEIQYLLSQIHLTKNQLEKAGIHCNNCMSGRREYLGENDKSYFQSLALHAEICDALGDPTRARIFRKMIPPDISGQLKKTRRVEHPPRHTTSPGSTSADQSTSGVVTATGDLLLAAGSSTGTLKFWDLRKGAEWGELNIRKQDCSPAAFTPDFRSLVRHLPGFPKDVLLYDLITNPSSSPISITQPHALSKAIAISSDGRSVALGSPDRDLHLWTSDGEITTLVAKRGAFDPKFGHREVVAVSFSSDGRLLASASANYKVRVWDVKQKIERCHLSAGSPVTALAFSPDGSLVVSGSIDNARLWNIGSHSFLSGIQLPVPQVYAIAFTPNGKIMALGSRAGVLQVASTCSKKSLTRPWSIEGYTGCIQSLAFSPDGLLLASRSSDNKFRLWDVKEGEQHVKLCAQFEGASDSFCAIGFVPKDAWSKVVEAKQTSGRS